MKVIVLEEHGYDVALFGLGLSYGVTSDMTFAAFESVDLDTGKNTPEYDRMVKRANFNYNKEGGHNKFLESMAVWLDVDAPRYFWQQMDTYRAPQGPEDGLSEPSGITKQSESTMHTLLKRKLTTKDFEGGLDVWHLRQLNDMVVDRDFDGLVRYKPESFLQRRQIKTNYKVLRNIYGQRQKHMRPEWHLFCSQLIVQLQHPEFLQ